MADVKRIAWAGVVLLCANEPVVHVLCHNIHPAPGGGGDLFFDLLRIRAAKPRHLIMRVCVLGNMVVMGGDNAHASHGVEALYDRAHDLRTLVGVGAARKLIKKDEAIFAAFMKDLVEAHDLRAEA